MIFGHSKVTPYPLTEPLISEPIAPAATITPGVESGTTQASSIPFPNSGLKLSYLVKEFIESCGGRAELEGKTTEEVNLQFQKKFSEASKLSFCDHLNQQQPGHPAVGVATVFISHAWKYVFLDVLAALLIHFQSEPDIIIWFDIFSVNQHVEVDRDFAWWSTTFKFAIRDFGRRTVMVLAPWHDPVPLQRGWCLFEIYSTIVTQSRFEVAMTQSSREAFLRDIVSDPTGSINKILATIEVAKSECFKPEDRERIFEIVRREVGVSEINSMIFERMRTWVIETTDTARNDDSDNLNLLNSLATLYADQGEYAKAEPLYVACLEKMRIALGEGHPSTLKSEINLALLYSSQGQYAKAEPLYVACLEKQRIALGESHPDTLAYENNLAFLYHSQGQYAKAEQSHCMWPCLEKQRIALGENHPDTLSSENNLAALFRDQGQYAKAEPLYVACLEKMRIALGESHPDILLSENGLALVFERQGQFRKAESLFALCLEKRLVVLGEGHPDTVGSKENLDRVRRQQLSVSGDGIQ